MPTFSIWGSYTSEGGLSAFCVGLLRQAFFVLAERGRRLLRHCRGRVPSRPAGLQPFGGWGGEMLIREEIYCPDTGRILAVFCRIVRGLDYVYNVQVKNKGLSAIL